MAENKIRTVKTIKTYAVYKTDAPNGHGYITINESSDYKVLGMLYRNAFLDAKSIAINVITAGGEARLLYKVLPINSNGKIADLNNFVFSSGAKLKFDLKGEAYGGNASSVVITIGLFD